MRIVRTVVGFNLVNMWIKVDLKDCENKYTVIFDMFDRLSPLSFVPRIDLYNWKSCCHDTFNLNKYNVQRLALSGIESCDAMYFKTYRDKHVCPNNEISDWLFDNDTITFYFTFISIMMYGV